MQSVTIYTRNTCGYCRRAKMLLDSQEITYTEIDIGEHPDKRAEMIQRADGRMTVPQIFIGTTHVGGSEDLMALHKSGELMRLVNGET